MSEAGRPPARRMSSGGNRKRKHRQPNPDKGLWGSLFHSRDKTHETINNAFYDNGEEQEAATDAPFSRFIWVRLWGKFNFWALLATLLFLSFTGVLYFCVLRMWIPQDLSDIAGYEDNAAPRDLALVLRNANGGTVSFTEAELNRYLRNTCRMRQTGIFSIITHCRGVAVRIHDGYAELIFDRLVGANIHQTTAVNLSFVRSVEMGQPKLRVEFRGGPPILGKMPTGGRIGLAEIPQGHMRMLSPALESLLSCYADIFDLAEQHHYYPVFSAGAERRVTLIPYNPSSPQ